MTRGYPNRISAARKRRLRARLAARDGRWCFYCRTTFDDLDRATFDHYIPRTVGKVWGPRGLVLACGPCNWAKADRLPLGLVLVLLASGNVPVPISTSQVREAA
ncbi:HNH endonuclease [Nonomuraea sp. NPDC049714]|uniref:HNH endonuclease n=1 Tax=Nonomuraea sp. NPDC049714 TaxID=3364357 RepID=UPI0037986A34